MPFTELKMKYFENIIYRTPIFPTNIVDLNYDIEEALYLSSPTLISELNKFNNKKHKIDSKIKISIYKYLTRASHRCTPFGLFAGLSIGKWGNNNNIVFDSEIKNTIVRKTRLDMNVLYSLAQELVKAEYIKPYLKFYPNTSIYLIGENYRYVEYYYSNNRRFHKINKVDFSEYIHNILNACKTGLTQQQISNLLIEESIDELEANDFVNELITAQLLVNELEPTLTGTDYFNVLLFHLQKINTLHQSDELEHLLSILLNVVILIKKLDTNVLNDIEAYKTIFNQLKQILPNLNETNLFQTDLYKKTIHNSLNSNIQKQINNAISFLNKIYPLTINQRLEDFKKRFYERYEDYEIPLSIALDTESGVGYPNKDNNGINELIEDVYTPNENNETTIKWNLLQSHLLKLITDSIKHKKKIIQITENDFKGIDFSKSELPLSFSIMFKVIDSETNKIEINGFGGSSAVNLLGRFAGGDTELENIVLQITDFEQQQMPDKILAEIVHLPESRTGNILARPCVRKYEIPYLAKSSVDDEFQIKMEDLFLKIVNNKIILFDKRLKKEIIPRLGNAHNYSYNSLPVYHFLCDMQTQYFSKFSLGFNWGELSNQFNFFPRVEYQNVILSSAKWQLIKPDLELLQDKKKTDVEKHKYFFELKQRIELPDRFIVAEGDNELLIDTGNPIALDTFIDLIKNKNTITLEEYLFDEKNALVKDSDGNSYTNECIAIVLNENNLAKNNVNYSINTNNSKSIFSIGSDWLYYKIYCGVKTADYILSEKIREITQQLLKKKIIDKWFFIRYADPDNHLRFRIHITDFNKYNEVIILIHNTLEPLINQHFIAKIQTDTYKRELNRYGGNSIDLAETLFFYDSIFVVNMLNLLDVESGGTIRWQIAIRSVDAFLSDFNFSLEEKEKWVEQFSLSFFNEHGGKKELRVLLDNKSRTLKPQIEGVLNTNNDSEQEFYPIIQLLEERSLNMKPFIRTILKMDSDNSLQVNLDELIGSFIHMNLDRLFMGRNRTNEFVVYDLLAKYYKSKIARKRKEVKTIDVRIYPLQTT